MFIWTGWAFGGNDYEASAGNRLCGRRGGAGRCAERADGWSDSALIIATLVCWEATLCSRSMGAKEERIIMTRVPRPGTRSPFKDAETFNMSSVTCARLSHHPHISKVHLCHWSSDNGPSQSSCIFSKLWRHTVRVRLQNVRHYNENVVGAVFLILIWRPFGLLKQVIFVCSAQENMNSCYAYSNTSVLIWLLAYIWIPQLFDSLFSVLFSAGWNKVLDFLFPLKQPAASKHPWPWG